MGGVVQKFTGYIPALVFAVFLTCGSAKAAEPLEELLGGMLDGCEYSEEHWQVLRAISAHYFEREPLVYPSLNGVSFGGLRAEDDKGYVTFSVPVMSMWRGLMVTHIGLEAMWETGVHVSTVTFGQGAEQVKAVFGADVARSNKLIAEWDDLDGGFSAGVTSIKGRGVLYCDLST